MKLINVFAIVLATGFLTLFVGNVFAQKECRPTGRTQNDYTLKNELSFDIEIRLIKPDCSEDKGLTVGAGREIAIGGFVGGVYRVYENWTVQALTDVKFKEGQLVYTVSGFEASKTDPSKKLCSRDGDPRGMYVRNATGKQITLKFVSSNCAEQPGPVIEPGKQLGANTFINNVFRAYETKSGTFISQFVTRPNTPVYVIGGERDPDPAMSFLKTVNAVRAYSGIPPLEISEKLNATCNWFAEFMSSQDQNHAGHLATDFTRDKAFKNMNTPTQRLRHFGWKKGDNAETTAIVRVEDPELIGAYFMAEWSSSTTHFMPFYDLYKTKFKKVGFAAVGSKKDPEMMYGCAIFANE